MMPWERRPLGAPVLFAETVRRREWAVRGEHVYSQESEMASGICGDARGDRQTSRFRKLLTQMASEFSDCTGSLVLSHERLTTHVLLIKNLYRLVTGADFVLCVTDVRNPG